jgi:hypothetical protein
VLTGGGRQSVVVWKLLTVSGEQSVVVWTVPIGSG